MNEPSRELIKEVMTLLTHLWRGDLAEFKAVSTRKGVDLIIGHKRKFEKRMSNREIESELRKGSK